MGSNPTHSATHKALRPFPLSGEWVVFVFGDQSGGQNLLSGTFSRGEGGAKYRRAGSEKFLLEFKKVKNKVRFSALLNLYIFEPALKYVLKGLLPITSGRAILCCRRKTL